MKVTNRLVISLTILAIWVLSIAFSATTTAFAAPASHHPTSQTLSAGGSDSDHDGLTKAQEAACRTDPKKADSDGDGILDGADDQDGDGLTNSFEFKTRTKCRSSDSDHDGISDFNENPDHDSLTNGQEQSNHSNPRKADNHGNDGPNHG